MLVCSAASVIAVDCGALLHAAGVCRSRMDTDAVGSGDTSVVMAFDSLSIDLGNISEDGSPVSCTFRWRNAGDEPVSVLMVRTTCACLAADFDRNPVQPGEYAHIVLTYHQKGHPGRFDRKAFVYAGSRSSAPSAILSVTGDVEPSARPVWQYPYAMGPLLLRRREIRIGGKEPQVERAVCFNDGNTPLSVTAASSLPAGFAFRCEPEVLEPGRTGELVVTFDPEKAGPASLPDTLALALDVPGLPEDARTLYIMIGETEIQGTSDYPGALRQ